MPFTLPDAFVEAFPDLRLRDLATIRDGITGRRNPVDTDNTKRPPPISNREENDAKVLSAMPPGPCGIGAIAAAPLKRAAIEASVRRLVEAGKVRRSGVARATVYERVAE